MRPQRSLPFARGSHTSYKAAVRAAAKRATKLRLYLETLYDHGGLIDHEAFEIMRRTVLLAPTSIQSIRNNAMDVLLVRRSSATRTSPYGGDCHVYELTDTGRQWVEAVRAVKAEAAR